MAALQAQRAGLMVEWRLTVLQNFFSSPLQELEVYSEQYFSLILSILLFYMAPRLKATTAAAASFTS